MNGDNTPDFTRTFDRSRDAIGRDTGWQLKDGSTIESQATYSYSVTDGRLASVANATDSFEYNYLPFSNLLSSITGPAHTVTNTWEANRDVLAQKQNKVGASVISSYQYSVNDLGQRTNVEQTGSAFQTARSIAWGYDSLGQVIKADSTIPGLNRAYQYDTIGNRIKFADNLTLPATPNYTANSLNQYTAVDSNNPVHDADGNATAYPLPTVPTVNSTLTWDAENRKISTTVGSATITTHYDAQSRRIAETTGSSTTLFVYDDWNCIAEYTGTTLVKTRLWGIDLSGTMQDAGGVGGLLVEKQGANSFYPTFDGNGNVSEYLATDGAITAHFEYDPFGNTVVNTDTAGLFNYRFSTKPLDFATGLYYYGYRWYDPFTGRWPSRDPIEERGGVNLYGFTNNNSLDRWDYLGQAWYDDIVDYFKDIPDATRECYGDTVGDIILSVSIIPFEEVATGDVTAIAAGALLNRIPGAKCGIKGAKKVGAAFKKGDGKCYQKVEVKVKTGKKNPKLGMETCWLKGESKDFCHYECLSGAHHIVYGGPNGCLDVMNFPVKK